MKPDEIQQLLQEADRRHSAVATGDSATLAEQVLARVAKRQRNQRRAFSAAGVMIIGITVGSLAFMHDQKQQQQLALTNAKQLKQLRAQIASQQLVVDRLIAAEQRLHPKEEAATPVVKDDPIERASAAMVLQADRVRDTPGLERQALGSYQQVIEHFPQTSSADLARRRAAELRKEG